MTPLLAARPSPAREAVRAALAELGSPATLLETEAALTTELAAPHDHVVVLTDPWPAPSRLLQLAKSAAAPAMLVAADAADEKLERAVRAAGAQALLRAPVPPARLHAAIQAIAVGLEAFESELLRERSHQARGAALLSARELQILEHIASGASNKLTASKLGISPNTIKFHLAAIFAKLGVTTRAEAVAEAIKRGEIAL